MLEKCRGRRGDDDVVDVEKEVDHVVAVLVDEQGGIGLGCGEADAADVGGEPLVPSSRCLLKSIQGLLQQAYRVRGSRVDEAFRLLAVDCLLEVAVKEGILHVELAYGSVSGCSNAEDGADRGRLDDRTEGLVVVDAGLL